MNAPVRREDQRFLTGKGRYADNTAPADALAVLFVRSPHAHARIVGIDKAEALAMPGVAAIYTAEDTAADGLGHLPAISEIKDAEGNRHREPPHLPMPVGKVRHVGDIVAMVDRRHARPGARCRRGAGRRLRAPARRRHRGAGARSRRAAGARRRAGQPDVPLEQGRRRGDRCRLRQGRARHDALDPLAAPGRALHGDARGVVGLRRRPTTWSPSPSPRRACRSRTG